MARAEGAHAGKGNGYNHVRAAMQCNAILACRSKELTSGHSLSVSGSAQTAIQSVIQSTSISR